MKVEQQLECCRCCYPIAPSPDRAPGSNKFLAKGAPCERSTLSATRRAAAESNENEKQSRRQKRNNVAFELGCRHRLQQRQPRQPNQTAGPASKRQQIISCTCLGNAYVTKRVAVVAVVIVVVAARCQLWYKTRRIVVCRIIYSSIVVPSADCVSSKSSREKHTLNTAARSENAMAAHLTVSDPTRPWIAVFPRLISASLSLPLSAPLANPPAGHNGSLG